jgi:hypothetical protein
LRAAHFRRASSGNSANQREGNSWQTKPRISDRARGRAAHGGRQAEPVWTSGRYGHPGCLPPRPQGLGAGGVEVGRHRPHTGRLHVRRAKGGDASVHPISARESRALRKLLRESPASPYVFMSERRAPLSAAGYQRMVARAGVAAKFTFLDVTWRYASRHESLGLVPGEYSRRRSADEYRVSGARGGYYRESRQWGGHYGDGGGGPYQDW